MNTKGTPDHLYIAASTGVPACPRCGGTMKRSRGDKRVTERSVACDSCGFSWSFSSTAPGLWTTGEVFSQSCPACQSPVVPSARYCVACGRALPGVNALFQTFARRMKVPMDVFEEQAWHEDNSVSALWEAVFWLEARSNELALRLNEMGRAAVAPALEPSAGMDVIIDPVQPASKPTLEVEVEALPAVPEPPIGVPEAVEPIAIAAADLIAEPQMGEASILQRPDPSPAKMPIIPTTGGRTPVQTPRNAIDLEQMISGRGMAFAGGAAVLLGAVFFLSLAFSRGWIGPELRVAMGVATAIALIMLGGLCFGRKEEVFGHVLTATGLGIMSLSMFAATRLYDLFPVELGLLGSIAAAGAAAAIAIRFDLQIVAGYGLVAALAAPPLLGASVNGVTIALLATTVIGITAITLKRIWIWLPPAAFLLASPQLADWIATRPAALPGIVALAGFWLLNALAAGGEAYQRPHSRLRPTSATLLVGNAAFLVWGGSTVLDNDFGRWGGSFLLGVALAHGALGGWFLRNRGDRDPFGMLAFGTGVAALTMAIPVQFGGPLVPLAFAAEAAALAWVAGRLKHPYAGATALLLGGLSLTHVLMFEYPIVDVASTSWETRAFLNGSFLTVAFQLLALAVAAYFVRIERVRQAIATVGVVLLAYALPFELSGIWLVAGWSLVAVAAFILITLPEWQQGDGFDQIPGRFLLMLVSTAVLVAAVIHVIINEYPVGKISAEHTASPPFLNSNGLALAMVLASLAVLGWIESGRYRFPATIAGIGLILFAMPFELSGVALVGGWALASLIPLYLRSFSSFNQLPDTWPTQQVDRGVVARFGLIIPGVVAWLLAAAHTLTIEFYDARTDGNTGTPFTDYATLAAGMLIAAAIGTYALTRTERWSSVWMLAAITTGGCLIPTQVGDASTVVGWSALGAISLLLAQRLRTERQIYLWAMLVLAGLGFVLALGQVAPPNRLFVDEGGLPSVASHPLFWSGASVALAALAALLAVAAWRFPTVPIRRGIGIVAGALAVYLLSVGIVDHFQSQVEAGGLDALQKQAQVALSILWAMLGGATFAAGIILGHRTVRLGGLALLAVATIKVFLYDMASLDASYRVLSLIGLGLLLLASSYLYMRIIGPIDQQALDVSEEDDATGELAVPDQPDGTLSG